MWTVFIKGELISFPLIPILNRKLTIKVEIVLKNGVKIQHYKLRCVSI